MSVQFIPSAEDAAFAVLPIADYRRLIAAAEDRTDVIDAEQTLVRIASGEEETLPSDFVAALLAGKASPLKLWRQYRAMTLAALGEACGVTRSALSQIESGKTKASAALLRKLALALRCDMEDLAQ